MAGSAGRDRPRRGRRPWRDCALGCAAAVLAAAVYANALKNGFVWDDPIILNRQLPVFRGLREIVLPPRNVPQFAPDYYRPAVIASYVLDHALGGGSPVMFHLTVVLAHVLATAAVYAFALVLYRHAGPPWGARGRSSARIAAVAAALFAVHPVHTEAVAWMAGRADVFATLFATAAAVLYLPRRRTWARGLVAFVCLLLALLSKEVAVAVVILLPFLDALFATGSERQRRWRAVGCRAWPVAAAFAAYWILRTAGLGGAARALPGLPPFRSLLGALGIYLQKLVYPFELNAYIDGLPTGAGWLATVAAVLLGIGGWGIHRSLAGDSLSVACLAWMTMGLAPSLAVVEKIPDAPVAERYLYFPSVGFCVLAAAWGAELALRAGHRGRIAMEVSAVGLLAVLGGAVVARNRIWRSDTALWTEHAAKSPQLGGGPDQGGPSRRSRSTLPAGPREAQRSAGARHDLQQSRYDCAECRSVGRSRTILPGGACGGARAGLLVQSGLGCSHAGPRRAGKRRGASGAGICGAGVAPSGLDREPVGSRHRGGLGPSICSSRARGGSARSLPPLAEFGHSGHHAGANRGIFARRPTALKARGENRSLTAGRGWRSPVSQHAAPRRTAALQAGAS